MYGVVLWSDPCTQKMLIWCEDHGHLAYSRNDKGAGETDLKFLPGDLVAFDVQIESGMRLAVEIELVAGDEFPTLAQGLREATPADLSEAMIGDATAARNVVQLTPDVRRARLCTALPEARSRKQA